MGENQFNYSAHLCCLTSGWRADYYNVVIFCMDQQMQHQLSTKDSSKRGVANHLRDHKSLRLDKDISNLASEASSVDQYTYL